MNDARQRHPAVPSSNQPPIPEWAHHFWYMLRVGALQAREDVDENTAAHLVNFMASMAVVTPCPECRAHFATDWEAQPFTAAHAASAAKAIQWVEDLKAKVEQRVQEQRKGSGGPAPAPAPAPSKPRATPAVNRRSKLRAPVPAAASTSGPLSTYAVRASLHVTQANQAGRRMGCNCHTGGRK